MTGAEGGKSTRGPFARAVLLLLAGASLSCSALDALCDTPGCEFSREEWARVRSLGRLGEPEPDPSNKYNEEPAAVALGHRLYFDRGFAGVATGVDVIGRPTNGGRAPAGTRLRLSCADCHDPARGGADATSVPGNVSQGAGLYDVNAPATVNAAYHGVLFWDARADSLWAAAAHEAESPVAMNGNRLAIAWRLGDHYVSGYDAAFTDGPLPQPFRQGSAAYAASLGVFTDPSSPFFGQCGRVFGACPSGCREVTDPGSGQSRCWPPYPLAGKPGQKAGCQAGDATEPFGDAFDCMAQGDRSATTAVFVRYTKALEAYQYQLVRKDAPFDTFVTRGPTSTAITPAARRGARLFVGKASCVECHSGPLLTTGNAYNIGVPQAGPGVITDADCPEGAACDCVNGLNCRPWGAYDGLEKLQASMTFRRDGPWSDDPEDDSRAAWYERTVTEGLIGTWRTPSLRNVALTPPYMHDGVYRTLDEVVRHYNAGGAAGGFPGRKHPQLVPLHLTDGELSDLVAFLESLTGAPLPTDLVTAPPGLPPPP